MLDNVVNNEDSDERGKMISIVVRSAVVDEEGEGVSMEKAIAKSPREIAASAELMFGWCESAEWCWGAGGVD